MSETKKDDPKVTTSTDKGHGGGAAQAGHGKVKPHMSATDGLKLSPKSEAAKGELYINKSGVEQMFENANGDHVHVPDGFCVSTEQVAQELLDKSDWMIPYSGDRAKARLAKKF